MGMKSKMGPSYTCLYLGYIEDHIHACYTGSIQQVLRHYIDDIAGCAYM